MHILALQPNLMSRSAGYATEHHGIVRIGRDAREQLTSANLRVVVWIAPPRHRARGQAAHLAELDGVPPDRAAG